MDDTKDFVPARDVEYVNEYMDCFYDALTEENREIGDFLFERASSIFPAAKDLALLDVACGPSTLYWACFLPQAAEHHALDVRPDNMRYVRDCADRGAEGDMHPRYEDLCAYMCERLENGRRPEEYFSEVCRRVGQLESADLQESWPVADASVHLVTSLFGLDHVDTPEHFRAALGEVRRVLAPDGAFVFVTLCDTESWTADGKQWNKCLRTTEESLRQDLEAAGFSDIRIERRKATTALEREQGYESMLFGSARNF